MNRHCRDVVVLAQAFAAAYVRLNSRVRSKPNGSPLGLAASMTPSETGVNPTRQTGVEIDFPVV